MRRTILGLAAAIALASAATVQPVSAMTAGTASAIEAALAETNVLQDVAYVCRHRYYSSRRVCWWQPGRYRWGWKPWRRWRR